MRHQPYPIVIDYQSIFHALPGMNLILSPELIIIGASKSYLQAFPCRSEELIGQPYTVLCAGEDAAAFEKWEASFRYVLAHRQPHTMEVISSGHEAAGGQTYWQRTNIPVLDEEQQQLQYILHEARDVTAECLAAKKIKEKEELFRLVSMATNDAIWDWNLPDQIISWNENFKTLFGYCEPFTSVQTWTEYIHPEDRERVVSGRHRVMEAGNHYWFEEYRFRCADGSYSDIIDRAYLLYGPGGRPCRMVGSMVDMTLQKEAENKVQEQAEFFEFLTNSIPAFIWTSDARGRMDFRNAYYLNFFDPDISHKGHFHWSEVLPAEQRSALIADWGAQIRQGKPFERELQVRAASGEFRWVLARANPQYNQEGRLIRWLGIASDIQEQKETQHQLKASMERFRLLAEAMPQKVWTALPDGHINYLNQQWMDYTGCPFEQLKGHGMAEVFHPDDLPAALQIWGQAIATGTAFQMEHRLCQADGTYRWHLGRGLPMRNGAGELVMWVGTDTDIHEQKLAQQELLTANQELQKINEDLDSFVYTASHDLKLPIINMGSIFEELMRSCEIKDPDQEKMVAMFHKSLEQIQTTISDLAEIAKVQKNFHQEKEEIDLQALTQEVLLSIQDQVKACGARVEADFAAVPRLYFSRVNLRSIFYNLISNAIKYQAPGRPPVVRLRTYPQDDYLVLAVQDNGLGMDLGLCRDKLFQMFKRFHTHVPGTGLGLYIIHRIMQNNNGLVEVDSNPNLGSTFRIYFQQT
jgi:PAS domain S-box-containing protein